jgi:protein ImuB
VTEPTTPVFPAELVQARLGFVEPLLTAGAFSAAIGRLVASVCAELEKAGQGARRLDLLFERVDGSIQVIRIGTARPSRDGRHLARMLDERLERVDPGLGVEAMRLVVPVADRLAYAQAAVRLAENDGAETDIAPLVDRLANRLGAGQIYRAAPVESEPPRVCRRLFGLN